MPARLLVVAATGVKQVAGKPLNLLSKLFSTQSYPPCSEMPNSNPCVIYSNGTSALKVCYAKGTDGQKVTDEALLIGFPKDNAFLPEVPFEMIDSCVCSIQTTYAVDNVVFGEINSVLSLQASGTSESENNNAISSLSDSCKSSNSDLIPNIVFGSIGAILILGCFYAICKSCKRPERQKDYQQIQDV